MSLQIFLLLLLLKGLFLTWKLQFIINVRKLFLIIIWEKTETWEILQNDIVWENKIPFIPNIGITKDNIKRYYGWMKGNLIKYVM